MILNCAIATITVYFWAFTEGEDNFIDQEWSNSNQILDMIHRALVYNTNSPVLDQTIDIVIHPPASI